MAGKVRHTLEERFWWKVDRVFSGECWNWLADTNKKGYGFIWKDGDSEFAHRVSWIMKHGEIPPNLRVLHRCDNPSCVNPEHLFLGTDGDNQRDKREKGRSARGSKNGNSKLTSDKVIAIRSSEKPVRHIAEEFGIDASTVYNIRKRKQWAHV